MPFQKYVLDRMPQVFANASTTEGLSQPTLFKQENSRSSNKGIFLSRTGGRALADNIRKSRAEEEK